jgi:ribosomal-protein-alanine N-acetyltransferase
MAEQDIQQVSIVEKDAFPELFPPTAFAKELKRERSMFFVAELDESIRGSSRFLPDAWGPNKVTDANDKTRKAYQNKYTGWSSGQNFIVGILGLWNMANQGHIVTLAVRKDYRRLGVGETILSHCLRICLQKSFINVTLEVRPSNKPAQSLYKKYGFKHVGLRKRYYTDDGEDALIMTTSNTNSPYYANLLIKHSNKSD